VHGRKEEHSLCFDAPVRITDVARWLERITNNVSMIADRMVKTGLQVVQPAPMKTFRGRNSRKLRGIRLLLLK